MLNNVSHKEIPDHLHSIKSFWHVLKIIIVLYHQAHRLACLDLYSYQNFLNLITQYYIHAAPKETRDIN